MTSIAFDANNFLWVCDYLILLKPGMKIELFLTKGLLLWLNKIDV